MTRLATMLLGVSVLVTGCDLGGQVIGPEGGIVVSDDGRFSIEVAPGALEDDVAITVEERSCATMDVDAVGTCYQVGPRGTSFLFPARVVVELDGGDIAEHASDRLALSGRRDSKWGLLADRDVDLDDGTISGSAAYLSAFAVVAIADDGQPKPAEREEDDQ